MGDFESLAVMGKIRGLTVDVYRITTRFPHSERFGISAQLRRAAVSIGANVAEGCGRNSDRQLGAFLDIALGSASEVCYLSRVARDLSFCSEIEGARIDARAREVRRRLFALRVALRERKSNRGVSLDS